MKQRELASLYTEMGFADTVREADDIISNLALVIQVALSRGESVKINSLITFDVVDAPERKFKNPYTRQMDSLPARKCLKLVASRPLKTIIKNLNEENGLNVDVEKASEN